MARELLLGGITDDDRVREGLLEHDTERSTQSRRDNSDHTPDDENSHRGMAEVEALDRSSHTGLEEGDGTLSPLDMTLEKIGFGAYQKALLILCGFGWMADNMWLQCIAVILPRVQEHFSISDLWIGLLSTSIFSGMMIGAAAWGSYSDSRGRTPAFNLTLLLTSIFGLASAFAPSFPWLCFALFWLGTGVGGSMPTDGTLFLENAPPSHHYLLTALSAFFSLGACLTSGLALYVIPRHSCPESPVLGTQCDVSRDNNGWRIMLGCLAGVSMCMFLSRIVFFRLRESAKFLVSSGRPEQAVLALERISRYNGDPTSWELVDVVDETAVHASSISAASVNRSSDYDATGETPTTGSRGASLDMSRPDAIGRDSRNEEDHFRHPPPSFEAHRSRQKRNSRGREWIDRLPPRYADSLDEYWSRIDDLFGSHLRLTTSLVWSIWFLASAGYTIFNVFLPKYLEEKVGESSGGAGRTQSLWDCELAVTSNSGQLPSQTDEAYYRCLWRADVFYTVSGLPGALLGAWLIESSLGRVKTLAYSTLATSAGTLIFVLVTSQSGVVLSSMAVSLAATLMYAVIYGYTPEAFPVANRGTACGIASALSRLAGIIAPIITGVLLSVNVSAPLFLSSVCFLATALAAWCLPIETRSRRRVSPVA